eukprot:Opistho-2@22654
MVRRKEAVVKTSGMVATGTTDGTRRGPRQVHACRYPRRRQRARKMAGIMMRGNRSRTHQRQLRDSRPPSRCLSPPNHRRLSRLRPPSDRRPDCQPSPLRPRRRIPPWRAVRQRDRRHSLRQVQQLRYHRLSAHRHLHCQAEVCAWASRPMQLHLHRRHPPFARRQLLRNRSIGRQRSARRQQQAAGMCKIITARMAIGDGMGSRCRHSHLARVRFPLRQLRPSHRVNLRASRRCRFRVRAVDIRQVLRVDGATGMVMARTAPMSLLGRVTRLRICGGARKRGGNGSWRSGKRRLAHRPRRSVLGQCAKPLESCPY